MEIANANQSEERKKNENGLRHLQFHALRSISKLCMKTITKTIKHYTTTKTSTYAWWFYTHVSPYVVLHL